MDTRPCRRSEQLMRRQPLSFAAALLILGLPSCQTQNGTQAPPRLAGTIEIASQTGVPLVFIPAGDFLMGSDNGNADEAPRHKVVLSPFAMDKFEVTQGQFAALQLPDPSQFKSADRPVEQIRWLSAVEFCNARSKAEELEPCYDEVTFECNFDAAGYRLPTEAEWEYAARAGVDTDIPSSNTPSKLKSYACYAGNSRNKTDPVGQKKPNAWGLHDMLGNVAEWCQDVYSESYYQQSPADNPFGPLLGDKRVMRGGSWKASEASCSVTARQGCVAGFTDACFTGNTLGFRCLRRLSPDELDRLRQVNSTDL